MFVLALVAFASVGCQRPMDERNALMSQNREAQAEIDRLRRALDQSMLDLGQSSAQNAQLQADLAAARSAGANNGGAVANQPRDTGFEGIPQVEIERTDTTVTVMVPGDVLFESGKVDIKDSSRRTLNEIATILQNQYAGKTILIAGYTDSDPIVRSGYDDNLQLSMERGAAVHRYLASRGLSDERMIAAGRGATHLMSTKEASRRVEIVVLLRD